jgi:hypothetical protein
LTRIGAQSAGLALAVPQVVGHRVTRMIAAGSTPDARDLREFNLMSSEKTTAFVESWMAMGAYLIRANQQTALNMVGSWWKSWFSLSGLNWPTAQQFWPRTQQLQSTALGMMVKGIEPVHKAAVANAKRLAAVRR